MGSQESPTSLHCYQITCSLTVQALDTNRFSGNKHSHKNAIISLGRNESREIVVHISFGPKICPASYLLKDVKVHYRFASEGKGSIQIPSKNIQLLFSNSPPERLKIFLKTLEAKLALCRTELNKTPLNNRKRLLSDLPQICEKLSPLTLMEIRQIRPGLVDKTNTTRKPTACGTGRTPLGKKTTPKARPNPAKIAAKTALTPTNRKTVSIGQ